MENTAAAAANNAAENAVENVTFEAENCCEVNTTKGKILSFFLSLPKGEKKAASDILSGSGLENGEGSPVIRQLYVSGIINQECRRGKYSLAEGVIVIKDSKIDEASKVVTPVYKWAGNKPLPCAENAEKGASKKSKKVLTASEIFEEFREKLSSEFQTALKSELEALEKGLQAEEEKAKKKAEEEAINAELEALEKELAEKRAKLAALRGKKA